MAVGTEIVGWLLIAVLFLIGMAGTVVPVLPGAVAIYAAFFVYGWFFGWDDFDRPFWIVQTFIVIVIFAADYAVSALGVKTFGGGKASIIGCTVGLMVGPFLIPGLGLVIGPFAGAVIGELLTGRTPGEAIRAGWGAVLGFFSSIVVKVILHLIMIALFFIWIL